MKRIIITIVIFSVLLLSIPLSVVITGFALPAQYGDTYYAELPDMYARLRDTEGKRIVVIGGSAVAFGLRGDLIESEFEDYTVCPFGLYGSIGTKFMMDLSEDLIKDGDIVLIAPEQSRQSMSLYFGAEYVWRAADCDFSVLGGVSGEDVGKMTGTFAAYVADKLGYYSSGSAPSPDGVYAHSSFNDDCMLVYDRPHNVMPDGVDLSTAISYGDDVMSGDFASYVNEYTAKAEKRGATVLFAFTPVNEAGVSDDEGENDPDAFYDGIGSALECDILGDPKDYIFEKEWFYDNNVHCNSAGAVLYTDRLVRDIKAWMGDTSPTEIVVPDMPPMPETDTPQSGDDVDAGMFEYEVSDGKATLVGMTDEGASRLSVTVPTHTPDGIPVTSIAAGAFADGSLTEIVLQSNIRSLPDGAFSGCASLTALCLPRDADPADCRPGIGLLDGAPDDIVIYVGRDKITDFAVDYFWSAYAHLLEAYE